MHSATKLNPLAILNLRTFTLLNSLIDYFGQPRAHVRRNTKSRTDAPDHLLPPPGLRLLPELSSKIPTALLPSTPASARPTLPIHNPTFSIFSILSLLDFFCRTNTSFPLSQILQEAASPHTSFHIIEYTRFFATIPHLTHPPSIKHTSHPAYRHSSLFNQLPAFFSGFFSVPI